MPLPHRRFFRAFRKLFRAEFSNRFQHQKARFARVFIRLPKQIVTDQRFQNVQNFGAVGGLTNRLCRFDSKTARENRQLFENRPFLCAE